MIRNGKAGDIVYLSYNGGPKVEVIGRRDYRGPGTSWMPRRVFYLVKLMEGKRKDTAIWVQSVFLLSPRSKRKREINGKSEAV